MSKKLLQINSRSNLPPEELLKEFKGAAIPISAVAGLEWKIFGLNTETAEAAGIYLFSDADALEAYLQGPIVAAMKSKGVFSDISMKVFDVADEASAVTRGPI
jgi:hypothetical protein